MQGIDTCIDGTVVHINDVLALLAIGSNYGILQVLNSSINRNNVSQLEECGLHYHVEAAAEAQLLGNLDSVYSVELDVVLGDVTLHGSRQMLVQLCIAPDGVQQEGAALLQACQQVILVNIGLLGAGNEVCIVNQIWRSNRSLAKSQMGHGDTAGLLGVISEISLSIELGLVADDLDSGLVGTNSTVGTQAPELAGSSAGRSQVNILRIQGQGSAVQVIINTDGEAVGRNVFLQLLIDAQYLVRIYILAAQAITAANDDRIPVSAIESSADILIQRLAQGTWLLGAVHNGNLGNSGRNSIQEMLYREWTEQMNCNHTNLLALAIEVINSLNQSLVQGTHSDNYALCIRCAIVIEYMVLTAGNLCQVSHSLLNQVRHSLIILIYSLASLEINIIVLGSTADARMVRIQGVAAEPVHSIPVQNLAQLIIRNNLNLLDFVGSTETVKEVQERNAALDGNQMSNSSQIHNFLYGRLAQHSHAGLACSHNILMIAKNVQGAGCQSTSTYMEYTWKQLTGYLVHVRNHQQHTLGCSIGGGQCTSLQRTVHSTSCTSLGLHLNDVYLLAEQVQLTFGCHLVNVLSHRRRRCNRIDSGYISKSVGYIRSSSITIHSFHFLAHVFILPLVISTQPIFCPTFKKRRID